jgi:hypothetical protein
MSAAYALLKSIYLDVSQPTSLREEALRSILPYSTPAELAELDYELAHREVIANAKPRQIH